MRSLIPVAFLAVLCVGCGHVDETQRNAPAPSTTPKTVAPANASVLRLNGPGGEVAIGDSLAQAKKAYPAPSGAQVMETSMSFAILGTDGWCWAQTTGMGFEAALRKGKIVALATTDIGGKTESKPPTGLGEPTRKAIGKAAQAWVWESGEDARFWVHSESGPLPNTTLTIIGKKDDIKLLGYDAANPQAFVTSLDTAASLNSKDLDKVMKQMESKLSQGAKK